MSKNGKERQVKISAENESAIREAIFCAEGNRLRVNAMSLAKVLECAKFAEAKLDSLGIKKKQRAGAEFLYRPCGPWAKSYKYGQGATSLLIERRSSHWFIAQIARIKVYPGQRECNSLSLTNDQDLAAVEFLREGYIVKKFATAYCDHTPAELGDGITIEQVAPHQDATERNMQALIVNPSQ